MLTYHRLTIVLITLFIGMASACETTSSPDEDTARYFKFTNQDEENSYSFVAKTSNPEVINKVEEELSKPLEGRNLHINGKIARGSKEYNDQWSWHFVPGQWTLAEVSIEVCDGRPGMVEENLDYWVDEVGRFCPWSSVVSSEVNIGTE